MQKAGRMEGYSLHLQTRADLLPGTVKHYLKVARVWLAYCQAHDLDYLACTTMDMLAWLRGSDLKTSTVRAYTIGAKQFYRYLAADGRAEDITLPIKTPKRRKQDIDPFPEDEAAAIMDACETPLDSAMVLLLYGSGLRRAELLGVQRKDFDFRAGALHVMGKGQKPRTVPVDPATVAMVRLALGERARLIPYGYDWLDRRFRYLCAKAKVEGKRNLHRMRHTFGTTYCEAGGNAEDLQMILGHTSLEQTLHYSQKGREQRAIKAGLKLNLTARLLR